MTRFVVAAVLLAGAGCQTYDFERVVPLAVAQTTTKTIIASKRLKPNVMLLVDNSGSMLLPTDSTDPACPSGCGSSTQNKCPATCPTRVTELKSAMASFLQNSGTLVRLGLTVFPVGEPAVCNPPTTIEVDFPPSTTTDTGNDMALTSAATAVNARIQILNPNGGTPTGSSLAFLSTHPGLNAEDFRSDFVLLLTDGLPNCNPVNPNSICGCGMGCSASAIAACSCTNMVCAGPALCSIGCLDQDGAVQQVKALRQRGIQTIVVGFGADLAGDAGPAVLNAMAKEGGFPPRECKSGLDSECGAGNTCNTSTKVCTFTFFQAANGAALADALRRISETFMGDPCEFNLNAKPSDARYLSVVIDNQSVAAGTSTYSYDFATNKVTFASTGEICARLKASTPQAPVDVEFRIVERF